MASMGNSSGARRRAAAGGAAVAALAAALGMAVGPVSPAGAAQAAAIVPGWVPRDHAFAELPVASTDGEITVTEVGVVDPNQRVMRSFRRDGTAVSYKNLLHFREHQWSPGGDLASGTVDSTTPATTTDPSSAAELLETKTTTEPSLWSSAGDSLVQQASALSYQPVARWLGSTVPDSLFQQSLDADPGMALPLPRGEGVLVSVPSSVAGRRDLGLAQVGPDAFPAFPRIAEKHVQPPLGAPQPLGYGELDPHSPAVSADGTLAFAGTTGAGTSLFVDEGSGPVAVASLGGECPGQRPSFAPSAGAVAFVVSAPDCRSSELRVLPKTNGTFVGGVPEVVATSSAGRYYETASWRPITPGAAVFRLAGKDRVATGIAVSEWNYAAGAGGAVIASATNFPDAVVGGPLAAQFEVPLLLTNPKALDSRVAAHLKKLTEGVTEPFVYIIGSAGAVSTAVETSLVKAGYDVLRIAGPDRYATSVEVARVLDRGYAAASYAGPRSAALLADGRDFPDALSAGPAASQLLAPVLLTNGTSVPAVVRNYVNSQTNIEVIHSVGRNAAQAAGVFGARASGHSLVGADRYATSALTARTFFAAGAYMGYASGESFPDALTGGAMMGSIWEPLVLVRPTTVPTTVRDQARAYRAGTDAVVVFGSEAVVSAGVQGQLVTAAGRQTALFGPSVEVVPNPALPATPADARLSVQSRDRGAEMSLDHRGGDAVPVPRHG